jgi:hypothetical protein
LKIPDFKSNALFIIGSLCTNVHKKVCNKGQKPVFGLHHLQVFYVELFCFVFTNCLFVVGEINSVVIRLSVTSKRKRKSLTSFQTVTVKCKRHSLENKQICSSFFLSFSLSSIIFIIYQAIFLKYIFFFRVVNTLVFSSTL